MGINPNPNINTNFNWYKISSERLYKITEVKKYLCENSNKELNNSLFSSHSLNNSFSINKSSFEKFIKDNENKPNETRLINFTNMFPDKAEELFKYRNIFGYIIEIIFSSYAQKRKIIILEKLFQITDEFIKQKEEIKALKKEINNLKLVIKEFELIKQDINFNDDYITQIKSVQDKIPNYTNPNSNLEELIIELKKQYGILKNDLNNNICIYENKKQEFNNILLKRLTLESKVNSLKQKYDKLDSELSEKKNLITSKTEEIKNIDDEIIKFNAENAELVQKNAGLQENLNNLKIELDDLEKDYKAIANYHKEILIENNKFNLEISELKRNISIHEDKIAQYKKNIADYNISQKENNTLNQESKELVENMNKYNNENIDFNQENSQLQKKKQELDKANQQLSEYNDVVKKNIEWMKNTRHPELKQKIENLNKAINAKELDISILKEQIDNNTQEIIAYIQSTNNEELNIKILKVIQDSQSKAETANTASQLLQSTLSFFGKKV